MPTADLRVYSSDFQPFYLSELPIVEGGQGSPVSERGSGNNQVVGANHGASFGKVRPDPGVFAGYGQVKGKDLKV